MDHLGLLVSTLAATTVVAKIWSVGHGSEPAVAALVSSGNALESVLGALIAGLPALGVVPILIASVPLAEAIREGDTLRGPVLAVVFSLAVAFAFAPLKWLILGAGWLAFFTLFNVCLVGSRALWARHIDRPLPFLLRPSSYPQDVPPIFAIAFVAAFAWIAVSVSDRPWMPLEKLETKAGNVVTGYVIDQSDWLTVLGERDRSVIRLEAAAVSSREVCASDGEEDRSALARLIWYDAPQYAGCP